MNTQQIQDNGNITHEIEAEPQEQIARHPKDSGNGETTQIKEGAHLLIQNLSPSGRK